MWGHKKFHVIKFLSCIKFSFGPPLQQDYTAERRVWPPLPCNLHRAGVIGRLSFISRCYIRWPRWSVHSYPSYHIGSVRCFNPSVRRNAISRTYIYIYIYTFDSEFAIRQVKLDRNNGISLSRFYFSSSSISASRMQIDVKEMMRQVAIFVIFPYDIRIKCFIA